MPTVLLIEDNDKLARGLQSNLEFEGYSVLCANDGGAGLELAREKRPDLIVLDLMLPDTDGYRVLRTLRDDGDTTPVLVLTALGEEADKVRGFRFGADDYVTKPFGSQELTARLRAVLRRVSDTASEPAIEVGELVIDLADRRVRRGDENIHLTPIEFDLLRVLAQNRGRLVTHRQLLQEVWGPAYGDETHYLRVHVAHIRSKIEHDPSRPRYVITEPGVGYRLLG